MDRASSVAAAEASVQPSQAQSERILRPEFTGSASEYFRTWIVNLFFTLIIGANAVALALAASRSTPDSEQVVDVAEEALVPERPKLLAVDPLQRQVAGLLEQRNYAALERLLGGHQLAFEEDSRASKKLENAFDSFYKVARRGEAALNEWVASTPSSYVALVSRGTFYLSQGIDARGTAYIRQTPEENIRTMQMYFRKATADLERSLQLTPKPFVSRVGLMTIASYIGSRATEKTHYLEGVKLAPQSVEIRLEHMRNLEPRWGGSYPEMKAFAAEARSQLRDSRAADRVAARIPAYWADERQSAKDFVEALKHYDEAIALDASPSLLCGRSYVLSQLKRDAEAFADVKLALSKVRDSRYCLTRAVSQATKASDAAEAIQILSLVIEVDPNSRGAFNERGWRYQKSGKLDLAFQDYLASAKLGDPLGELQVGKFYWSGLGVKQDREEAIVWLRKAAAHGDRDAQVSLQQALELRAKL